MAVSYMKNVYFIFKLFKLFKKIYLQFIVNLYCKLVYINLFALKILLFCLFFIFMVLDFRVVTQTYRFISYPGHSVSI